MAVHSHRVRRVAPKLFSASTHPVTVYSLPNPRVRMSPNLAVLGAFNWLVTCSRHIRSASCADGRYAAGSGSSGSGGLLIAHTNSTPIASSRVIPTLRTIQFNRWSLMEDEQ